MNTRTLSLRPFGKLAVSAALLGLLLVPCGRSAAAEAAPGSASPRLRLRIAVDQCKWNEIRGEYYNLPRDLREGLQAQLVEKLQASGMFQVMEREATAIRAMRQEDAIDAEKREATRSAAALPARQRRTAARYIITPTVTGFEKTGSGSRGGSFGGIRIGGQKESLTMSLSIRISDAETSEVLETSTAVGKVETRGRSAGFKIGRISLGDQRTQRDPLSSVIGATLNDAVGKIVRRLSREPWSALVAAMDPSTGRVIINAGTDAGVSVGQELLVCRSGPAVTDPSTGDVLSRGDETQVGRIRIVRVERSAAYGEVVKGKGLQRMDVVRAAE